MDDTIKVLLPFLTFLLGMVFTPFIENLKLKAKAKAINKSIINEIKDEYFTIAKSISKIDKSIKERKYKPKNHVHLSLPISLNLLLLENSIIEVYPVINKEFRRAYKSLLNLQKSINDQRNIVMENYKDDNSQCLASERSMQYEMLSAYYLMNKMLTNEDFFEFPTLDNEKIVKLAAEDLNVRFPFE